MQEPHSKIGAAILGIYAAIKICEDEGYDADKVWRWLRKEFNKPEFRKQRNQHSTTTGD